MKSNKRGVTLLELVIVFAIIAVGAVLAVPNIGPWIANYRLRTATRDITSALRVAQMRAVSYNINHRVSFDRVANEYLPQVKTTTNVWQPTWTDARTATPPLQQKLPKGITIPEITFPSDGTYNNGEFTPNSTASSGRITLQNTRGTTKTITVLPSTGRITSQ